MYSIKNELMALVLPFKNMRNIFYKIYTQFIHKLCFIIIYKNTHIVINKIHFFLKNKFSAIGITLKKVKKNEVF